METLILVCVIALLLFSMILLILSRYKKCPSDKVMVIYGKVGSNKDGSARSAKCIHGGAAFVWPVIQAREFLDLTPLSISVDLENALSRQNIRINVPSRFTVGISTEPAVIESGFSYLARILPFYWMLAIMFVLSSIMRGAGEMMVPMISSLAALWLARVPAAYLLAHFFGPMNIHFCYAIGWALGLAICVPYYFSGRWKEKSIVVRAAGGS